MEYNWTHPEIGPQQLGLNLTELTGKDLYPIHWHDLLNCLKYVNITGLSFYDFGCGVGSTYKLLVNNNINVDYIGIDISESMIELAKKTWNYSKFRVGDVNNLDDFSEIKDQVLYCSGIFQVMFNGLSGLKNALSAGSKYLIINRDHVEESSNITTYTAYNTITCAKYVFARDDYDKVLKEYGYVEEIKIGNCRVLKRTSSA